MGAVSNAATVECALTMGVICTNTFPGTGSAWTAAANNSSDGSAWTQTVGSFTAWTSISTTASGNVGTFTGTGAGAGSGAAYRTGASSPNDAMTTAVISLSNGWGSTSNKFGVITNKTTTTVATFYYAYLDKWTYKSTTNYGLVIARYSGGTPTLLLQPIDGNVTGVGGSTSKWVVQLRSIRVDGGASILLQARAWKGTNPATPPSGADWVQSGLQSGTDYVTAAVTDSSPLAAGRGGLFAYSAGTAMTATAEQFEFRSMSATSISATATGTATVTTTRQRITTILANASGTASSAFTKTRAITQTAIATGTASLTKNVALIRSGLSVTTSSISKLVSIVRSSIATGTATGSAQKLLAQPVKTLQLACRSTIKLVIDSKVALRVRSTMKLPKE